ncbi:MAG: CAP domain-containing protein [Candidatus Limnocylindrales bacterium]
MPGRPTRITSLAMALAALLAVSLIGPATADIGVARVVSAETYARSLLNCTRSGGWVEPDGSCIDRGSGKHSAYRKPLPEHRGISRKVAWPWARAMVANDVCGHVISGKPELGTRLARKGFSHRYYGENVGCGWGHGSAHDVVLASHLAMQAEKPTEGWHWKNMKDPGYRSVGIGVATRDGTTMVVYDFYGRRW